MRFADGQKNEKRVRHACAAPASLVAFAVGGKAADLPVAAIEPAWGESDSNSRQLAGEADIDSSWAEPESR